ncbi:MAG: hypothetical protein ACE5ID_06140, partial [Acidobacteriota bacterium]
MTHPRSPEQRIEEMSEEIWSLAERGERSRTQLIKGSKLGEESAREVLQAMLGKELIQDLEGEVSLLPAGEALARLV